MKRMTRSENDATTRPAPLRRLAAVTGATALAILMMLAITPGVAALAQDITQCDAVGDGGGQGLECHVEVINVLDLTDPAAPIQSSTVTVTSCLGSADAAVEGVCTSTGPVEYAEVVTDIDQCNYAVNGGGSTLLCTVDVLNYVTGGATPTPATVNECNDSLTTGDVLVCDPYLTGPEHDTDPATATVVQCNDSDNGGGSVLDCSVAEGSTTNASLVVRVNQCNNSANGGGSVVICRTMIRNAVRVATTVVYTPPVPVITTETSPEAQEFVPVLPEEESDTETPVSTTRSGTEYDSSITVNAGLALTGETAPTGLAPLGAAAVLLGALLLALRRVIVRP